MSLVSILKAVHCRSTHHYFAIDALALLKEPRAQQLAQLLLKYYEVYLDGAKAPDKKFRDFQNHVLHVEDGCWGGAMRSSQEWYDNALELLNQEQWRKAAYAIGVLSHYCLDPLMPLHTAQSPDEGVVHRPLEWQVFLEYPRLLMQVDRHTLAPDDVVETNKEWLSELVAEGARCAHQFYEPMIQSYLKLCKHEKRPRLNRELDAMLLQIYPRALQSWATVLQQLTIDSQSPFPNASLSLTTLMASVDMPLAWIVGKLGDFQEQRSVAKIIQEYQTTGEVRQNLPRECQAVRQERLADRRNRLCNPRFATQTKTSGPVEVNEPQASRELTQEKLSSVISNRSSRVSLDSELVDAPSIGPKTASRFEAIGITTIREFLASNVEVMQQQLDTRWITATLLRDWQDQARLVCLVQELCGYKAQLLVGVNCRSRAQLASTNADELHSQVHTFAQTKDGERILRSAKIPTREEVATWIACAKQQRAAA